MCLFVIVLYTLFGISEAMFPGKPGALPTLAIALIALSATSSPSKRKP